MPFKSSDDSYRKPYLPPDVREIKSKTISAIGITIVKTEATTDRVLSHRYPLTVITSKRSEMPVWPNQ